MSFEILERMENIINGIDDIRVKFISYNSELTDLLNKKQWEYINSVLGYEKVYTYIEENRNVDILDPRYNKPWKTYNTPQKRKEAFKEFIDPEPTLRPTSKIRGDLHDNYFLAVFEYSIENNKVLF